MAGPAVEVWKPTHLHPEYDVSDQGRVRRRQAYTNVCKIKPLKPYDGKGGYPKVQLGYRGPRVYVHVLVAHAFLEPRRPGQVVDHRNHVRTDNRAVNLRWLTPAQNQVVFGGRTSDGKIIWLTTADLPEPEDHIPMTDEEYESYEPAANGW